MTVHSVAEIPVLSVLDLRITFSSDDQIISAVDGVSFSVGRGEVVALVGESGSGKTVTARAVLGLLPSTAAIDGSALLSGQELLGRSEAELTKVRGARVAMVFQEPSTALNPVETVGWQIGEALRAHQRLSRAARRARAIELLGLTGIPEPEQRIDSYPHQLSGGQKQRVVIAIALANEPELIIADEPTTALDVTIQAEILLLLRQLRDRLGMAVLLITHNMGVVADLADRVVVLRGGKVEEIGTTRQVFERPAAAYTQELLASVPRLDPIEAARPAAAPAETVEPALAAIDLSVTYPGRRGRSAVRALHEVTLALMPGRVLGLVGESGSGKSTMGRVAVGLLRPAAGRVTVLGVDTAQASTGELRAVRRRIGVVYQDPAASLDPLMTVGESVGEPLAVHRVAAGAQLRARVGELLEAVQLPAGFADRRPRELSGGQRQRAALARAIALEPELLIADEPTSALDVTVQAAVLAMFAELQEQRGFACLFISHDLAVVDQLADEVAVLRAGELIERGPPEQVLRRPATDYTRRLLESVPVPDPVEQAARRERRAPPSG
jgi:peptide/nickel transport system ATP-binding protein